jgi:hypothetical protein
MSRANVTNLHIIVWNLTDAMDCSIREDMSQYTINIPAADTDADEEVRDTMTTHIRTNLLVFPKGYPVPSLELLLYYLLYAFCAYTILSYR